MQTCRCITFSDLPSFTLFNRCPALFRSGNHHHLHSSTNFSLNPKTHFTTHYKKEKGVNYLFHNLMETLNPNQCIQSLNLTRVQLSCGHFLSTTNLQPNLSTGMNQAVSASVVQLFGIIKNPQFQQCLKYFRITEPLNQYPPAHHEG